MFSKSILTSVSFWGLVLSVTGAGTFLDQNGIDKGAVIQQLILLAGGIVTLVGIVRRKDIHVIGPVLSTKPVVPPAP